MSEMEVTTASASRSGTSTASSSLSSSSLNCTFLGSLSSRRGREILSQLCLQIAQQSKLQHHFVERKDMDKITRQFFNKSTKKALNRLHSINFQKSPEQTMPLEMKVFFVRDQLERIADEQKVDNDLSYEIITISGPQLIDFLLGTCGGLFRTTPQTSVGHEILGNVLKRRRRGNNDSLLSTKITSIQYNPRVNYYKVWRMMHRRRLGKTYQRTKYQQPRAGIIMTKHQSPIVCLRMYRGLLYSCSLNGQVRFYQIQTLNEHPRHQPIFTPNGGSQTLQVAHCKRFSGTILCIAGFDQTVRLYRDHPLHEPKGEITLAAPVHCTAVKFHILMVGLGSGEVAFISLKKMCVIHTIKCSPYVVSAVAATRDPDGRHLLIASSFDGAIVVISLLNEQRRLTLTGHTKSPRQLIVDSIHHLLYSCSADKKIIVHNFLNGAIIYEYKEFEKAVTNIAMNQQQHLLIASSLDGLIKIFNIQTHELIQQLTTTTSQSIISMIFKNNLVYCGMESGIIEVLQCDINQVYRCEYASCRQPFSRREDVFIHARLFHVQHSSTIQRCLWKQCMKWVPLKKFSDHLRVHTDNLILETKLESPSPSTVQTPMNSYGFSSDSLITNYSSKTVII
ncbi:unnamed protein product [Rotaria sp. Silwood1]|nr:unnamed protein product [Rotaria sp. Silwood1]CAF3483238.1 unnamed protein product [Rotaria sp. Silwood1]CAF3504016.1 unnamed protein product [Rotaria sp. Silwood1]CAF4561729.1 unnamed protein product [Rotaria sp. Silwood1]CAF4768071.1 unnamed protein product [Rotaria sp. Silwood1]